MADTTNPTPWWDTEECLHQFATFDPSIPFPTEADYLQYTNELYAEQPFNMASTTQPALADPSPYDNLPAVETPPSTEALTPPTTTGCQRQPSNMAIPTSGPGSRLKLASRPAYEHRKEQKSRSQKKIRARAKAQRDKEKAEKAKSS
ncbi:hypothetical protein LTR08_003387 [Meristemomyces frigidus]|nr:hypothetical protein LTR08_003387 [Meristemomyces frigidus]